MVETLMRNPEVPVVQEGEAVVQPSPQVSEQSETTVQVPVEQGETSTQPQTDQDDILSRVSKFIDENAKQENPEELNDSSVFNDAEFRTQIDAIQDPIMKEQMIKMRKSGQAGINSKFQELASMKKDIESIKQNTTQPNQEVWTPERVQQLTQDPNFVQAAQQVAGAQDESSMLSEAEKAQIGKISALENELTNMKKLQVSSARQQQHQDLQAKYSDYNPQAIDTITADMISGKIQATPEHIYKAFNYDEHVRAKAEAGYKLGRQDERSGIKEKVQSVSVDGINTVESSPAIVRQDGESSEQIIKRIIDKNLRLFKKK